MKKRFTIIATFALLALTTITQAQKNQITRDAGTKTTSFNGNTQTNSEFTGAMITVTFAAVSATLSPSCNVQLQYSPDAGTTWINYGDSSSSITSSNKTIGIFIYPTNWTVAGSSPATLAMGTDVDLFINGALPKTWRLVYHIRKGSGVVSAELTGTYVNYLE